ncbi:MAG: DUF6152 family protein [Steroidobacteraceae bacterium]
MKLRMQLTLLGALALGTAQAHHSTAMFDTGSVRTLNGTIEKFEWTNPHVWIWIVVPRTDGGNDTWGIESAAPVQLRREGLAWDSFKTGDKVTMTIHPMKSGETGGQFLTATFADGHKLSSRDPAAQAPPPGPAQ